MLLLRCELKEAMRSIGRFERSYAPLNSTRQIERELSIRSPIQMMEICEIIRKFFF